MTRSIRHIETIAVQINAFHDLFLYCRKPTTAIIMAISQNKRQFLFAINNNYMKLK